MTPPVTPNYSYGGMGTKDTTNYTLNIPRTPTGSSAKNPARDGRGIAQEDSVQSMNSTAGTLASERLAVDDAFGTLPRAVSPRTPKK